LSEDRLLNRLQPAYSAAANARQGVELVVAALRDSAMPTAANDARQSDIAAEHSLTRPAVDRA